MIAESGGKTKDVLDTRMHHHKGANEPSSPIINEHNGINCRIEQAGNKNIKPTHPGGWERALPCAQFIDR